MTTTTPETAIPPAPKPCSACPWVSRDPRDKAAVSAPAAQEAMKSGRWFCCHVDLGTCHGAALQHAKYLRREATS